MTTGNIMVLSGLLPLIASIIVARTIASSLETQCFFVNDEGLQISGGGPCGIVTPDTEIFALRVVFASGGDRAVTTNSSGFYVGGCTDSSMEDPTCSSACNDQSRQDAVYNATTEVWACCGVDAAGEVQCNDPTKEIFVAPAPKEMSSTFSVGDLITAAASTSASFPSASQTTKSSATTTSVSQVTTVSLATSQFQGTAQSTSQAESSSISIASPTHKKLSTGTLAAIGIGSTIGVFAILGSIFFLWRRYHQKEVHRHLLVGNDQRNSIATSYPQSEQSADPGISECEAPSLIELDGRGYATEMASNKHWPRPEKSVELP